MLKYTLLNNDLMKVVHVDSSLNKEPVQGVKIVMYS